MNLEESLIRCAAVYGNETIQQLKKIKVAIFGVGGVGSWCAEALVRSGVKSIALIDDDVVAPSNINRQCPATAKTIGRKKVEVMKERLLEINPGADIVAIPSRYEGGEIGDFDVVVDAIDSVDCKAELILSAQAEGIRVISSMGAALRKDPTKVRVTRWKKVEGDGLAKALRKRFKRLERKVEDFECVWSEERPLELAIRGSVMAVTATFGMCLAAEVIKEFEVGG